MKYLVALLMWRHIWQFFFQTLFNKWFNYETYFYSLFIFMYYNRPTSKKTLDEIRHLRTETLSLS